MDYVVPMAVLKFRQGFGRLIRRRSDRGTVLVLDSRTLTKPYGKLFLESLPDVKRVIGSREEVLREVVAFYERAERQTR